MLGGGGGDMGLMAADTSAKCAPTGDYTPGRRLPFYSRFHTDGTGGVDELSHDVSHMPGSNQTCFGYCFPQSSLVGVVLVHLSTCEARAVIVVPNTRASWFPVIAEQESAQYTLRQKERTATSLGCTTNAKQSGTQSVERWASNAAFESYDDSQVHRNDTQSSRTAERAHIKYKSISTRTTTAHRPTSTRGAQ